MEAVNELSAELTKIVNAARPKKGQVIYFRSLRPDAGGTRVKNIDRIYDPWKDNGDGTKGSYVDIGYVTGQLPAIGSTPARHNFGRIQFTKSSANIIGLSGNNRAQDTLFLYFFLCNFNKMNMGKDWYSPSDGQMPLFEMMVPEMQAEEKNKFRRRVRQAGEKIDQMPDEKLLSFAMAMDMHGINEFSKMEEIRDRLYIIAEKDPDKVMNMDKDVHTTMKIFIKEAIKYGIWEEDKILKLFRWPETQDPVFLMTPGQDLYAETIKYLLGNGESTYEMVSGLIHERKAKEAKDKASDNKGQKNQKPGAQSIKVTQFSEASDD